MSGLIYLAKSNLKSAALPLLHRQSQYFVA
jgi:hypothetical protein